LTGLQPHEHGITGNDPVAPQTPERREQIISKLEAVPTLPRLLAEQGYISHQSGKWWEGHYSRGGFSHGMSHGDPDRGGRHGDMGLTIGREGMAPVFDFIQLAKANDRPFFIWYAPFLPHTPHNPPERLLEKFQGGDLPIEVARYYAMVEWFDETVGELLGHLDEQGLTEDTMVIYIGDNGWIQMHAQMPLPQNWRQEGYAPRSKRSPYDGGIRTPVIIRWPGAVEPMRDDRTLVHATDLAPTILAAAGLEPVGAMMGIDLRDDQALAARTTVFGAVFDHDTPDPLDQPAAGLRYRWAIENEWKLIYPRYSETKLQDVEIQLFNIIEDPFERRNRVDDDPERALRMKRIIDAWWPGG
jgi:arylsulfatase A-like enzyme